ncbi:50S ribosomal protein L15 [ANME-1 cluster archaeon AG-394-G21]|nr:50S ribosomal protein L15 [ANME-1 cluster archaeon AG-394-G21]
MKKRVKRIRGTRTCGGGSHKKRRGSGSRGGVGNAGAHSHHVVRSLKMGIVKGMHISNQHNRHDEGTLNIGILEEMLEELIREGKAEEKADGIYLDVTELGIEKILGKGKVTKKLMLTANAVTETAKGKIESAGGTVSII